jgi:hypothetical protein
VWDILEESSLSRIEGRIQLTRSILFLMAAIWSFLLAPALAISETKEPVGKFVAVEGKVFLVPETGGERLATVGTLVYLGDTVRTGADSRAKLLMIDDSLVTVSQETELSLKRYLLDHKAKEREGVLSLLRGKVKVIVARVLGYKGRYEVETRTAVAGVRGTSMVVWTETDPSTGKLTTWVFVLEGELYVTAQGVTKILGAGMIIEVVEGQPPKDPREATREERNKAMSGTHVQLLPGAQGEWPGFTIGVPTAPGPPETPPPPTGGGEGATPPSRPPLPPPPPPPK